MDQTTGLRQYPLGRRGMVMTGLMTGFTLATTRVEAQAIHTDANGIWAEEVKIPVADGTLPGYAASPGKNKQGLPIVLVIEEIFGVHEYIKDICRRLAKEGYVAVAPELYARLGDLSKMTDVQQIFRDVISRAPDAQVMSDLDSTAAFAQTLGGSTDHLGVTGFCRGGRDTWLYAAHSKQLKAAVAWYGPVAGTPTPIQPRTAADVADQLNCPLLGLYGGQDNSIAVADVQAAAVKAKAAGRNVQIVIYPDAPHGFHADYRPSYHEADAKDGWAKMLAFFRAHGVG